VIVSPLSIPCSYLLDASAEGLPDRNGGRDELERRDAAKVEVLPERHLGERARPDLESM
jgi:hypothetical protein